MQLQKGMNTLLHTLGIVILGFARAKSSTILSSTTDTIRVAVFNFPSLTACETMLFDENAVPAKL